MKCLIILVFVLLINTINCDGGDNGYYYSPPPPTVCINNGCISGKLMAGYRKNDFHAFLGIPFAQPPVDDLRFRVS